MRNSILLILLVFCIPSCNVQADYSKDEALVQSFQCLKIKQELGVTSNLRNPYLIQLVEILKNDTIPNESLTDSITTLSIKINQTIKNGKELIKNLRQKHQDTRFFDATIEYLELNEKLEAKTKLLYNSLINPNGDRNMEILLVEEVETLAEQVLTEQIEYKKKESEFHNENNIIQREVDSIVNIIKKK